jgi:hypothetical protein
MGRVRVRLTRSGPRQLRQSAAVRADLEARARRIARAAGPGMTVDSTTGRSRARATVFTDTFEARRNEARHRALTRAIDAGR